MTDIPLNLEVEPSAIQPFPSTNTDPGDDVDSGVRSVKINDKNVIIIGNRKRSNSQSQVTNATPTPPPAASNSNVNVNVNVNGSSSTSSKANVAVSTVNGTSSSATSISSVTNRQHTLQPKRRNQLQHYVTLVPLNDTFIKKHLPVSIFPETTKLGRPTGTKHKPDVTNGYFESRVLSRNHAQIYIDPTNGKLMLQDLHSSNGTYVNEMKLTDDPVEINIGDIVCLGFNVQTESTHKQISLRIDNINIIPNTSSGSTSKIDSNASFQILQDDSSTEFKHLSFVEDIYRQIKAKEEEELQQQPHQKQQHDHSNNQKTIEDLSFDSALFGDINPELEDNLLGLYSGANSGIFNNSQITNSNTFESIINQLVISLSKIKQQNNNLTSISQFLTNYQENASAINSNYLEKQFQIKSSGITQELHQEKLNVIKLNDQLKTAEKESTKSKENYSQKLKSTKREFEDLNKRFDKLREKYDSLQTQLELEKKKNEVVKSPNKDHHEFADASNELLIEEFDSASSQETKDSNQRAPATMVNGDGKEVYFNSNQTHSANQHPADAKKSVLMTPNTPNDRNHNVRQAIARNDAVDLTPPISDNEDNGHANDYQDSVREEDMQSSISTLNGVFHDTEPPTSDIETDTATSTNTTTTTSTKQQSFDTKYWIPVIVLLFSACLTTFYVNQEPNVVSNYIYNSLNS